MELDVLRWQLRMTRDLAAYHIPMLTDAACLWAPAPSAWTVHRGDDGHWRPDWSDQEVDPAPAVTIGWLSWHLLWWGEGFLRAWKGEPAVARELAFWPGDAAGVCAAFDAMSEMWASRLDVLPAAELDRPLSFPWREPRPLRFTLAWANAELMKNISEIGVLRHLYEAGR